MALNMKINLEDATYADLVALVKAAEVAGVDKRAPITLDGTELSLTVTTPGVTVLGGDTQPRPHGPSSPTIGDAAIRSVIDILTGRTEPPRA